MGETFFLIKVFFIIPQIEKYDAVFGMGALNFWGVELIMHDNKKTRNQNGGD